MAALVRRDRARLAGAGPGVATDRPRPRRSRSQFRRSLYVAQDLQAGEVLTRGAVRAIRPGAGPAAEVPRAGLGARVARDVARGTPLSWDLLIAKSDAQ